MRGMKKGDHVMISMKREDHFDFQTSHRIYAEIVHVPQATGDLFEFTSPFCPHFFINPASSDFIGMTLRPEDG